MSENPYLAVEFKIQNFILIQLPYFVFGFFYSNKIKSCFVREKKMSGSSSKSSPIHTFSGEGYSDWSKKMKKHLISEGLWLSVEEGCKKPNQTEGLSATEMEELKQEMVNDAKALSLIHQSLSPTIFMRIFGATTAKEAWDTLHSMFQADTKVCVCACVCVDQFDSFTEVLLII